MIQFGKLKEVLKENKKVVITTHKSPDGDAIGSSLGLWHVLKKMNISCSVLVPDAFPKFLNWIDGTDNILVVQDVPDKCKQLVDEADVIFCLDYNALHRINELGEWIGESNAYKVMIDHHQEPEAFSDVMISNTLKSSTCEMLFDFIEEMGWEKYLDEKSGAAIYCGIITDTGSFKYPGTTQRTHEVASKLIELGVDNAKIHREIFDSNSISRIKVLGRCLNNMEYLPELKTTVFYLSKKDAEELNLQKGDAEGIVNFGLSIKEVVCSVMIKEDVEIVKMSFRSKGDFDVSKFARTYFEGGGHKNAAGGACFKSLNETIKLFKDNLKAFIND